MKYEGLILQTLRMNPTRKKRPGQLQSFKQAHSLTRPSRGPKHLWDPAWNQLSFPPGRAEPICLPSLRRWSFWDWEIRGWGAWGLGRGGLKSMPKGHHHCGLCSLGAAEPRSVPADQTAPAGPWPPRSPWRYMCLEAVCLAPQPSLTAHLYYVRVFWVFFPWHLLLFSFEEAGHPPLFLLPSSSPRSPGVGRGSCRGWRCQKRAGACAPPNPSSTYSGVTGKKKNNPKPRNTNWTQKGRCRLNRKRWPEAKWNSCCHCSAFANSARLGLREQMLAITAHEKKGTGLGKWRKSKGTARFITGGARQPLSGGRRQPAPRCPCPGRGYSAGTRRQSPGRPRTGSPATPGPPRQGPGPPGDAFPRRCFAKAKVAAEGSGSSRRDLPTGSRGEPSSAARDLLGAAEPRQIFTSCQWRLTLLVPSRGIPPGVGGAGRAGLSLRANFISSSLCTTGTKNKQTKHKLYIPCEISSGLPYNQSCKIKKNKIK